jgi:hypothetical protein
MTSRYIYNMLNSVLVHAVRMFICPRKEHTYLFCFKFAGQFEVEDLKKDFFSKELVKQIYSGYAYN